MDGKKSNDSKIKLESSKYRKGKKRVRNKKVFYISLSIIAVLIVVGIGLGINHYKKLKNPQDLFIPDDKDDDEELDIDIGAQFDKNVVNILLVGFDRNEGRTKKYSAFRTDTNIVLNINLENKTVNMLSIPRDSYVSIAGMSGKKDKFNSSFVYGYLYGDKENRSESGYKYLIDTTRDLLGGIPLHYYLAVDMDVVVDVVEAIGGVEMDVPLDVMQGKKVRIEKGLQTLDGKTLLFYARNRTLPGGDIDRVKNQQQILMAIFNTLKKSNKFVALPKIYKSMRENIETNMNFNQLTALALFGRDLDRQRINMKMMEGFYGHFNERSYWIINQRARVELIEKFFGIEVDPAPQDPTKEVVQSFKVNISKETFEIGDKATISVKGATNINAYKEFKTEEIRFVSSDTKVLMVDKDGNLEALGAGEATITVTIGNISQNIMLTVIGPEDGDQKDNNGDKNNGKEPDGKDPNGKDPDGEDPNEEDPPDDEDPDNEPDNGSSEPNGGDGDSTEDGQTGGKGSSSGKGEENTDSDKGNGEKD